MTSRIDLIRETLVWNSNIYRYEHI